MSRASASPLLPPHELPFLSPRAARLGTLRELTKLAPIAIIAEALGYTNQTIERHARGAAATYAEYVATRR
ncbi:hypothetical protein [Kribbella sp. C-35]|uniref:hypothetical protein n=1 Tax=Kribbella sp. C-35 TaxID=2789276 RepID=UPI00397C0839